MLWILAMIDMSRTDASRGVDHPAVAALLEDHDAWVLQTSPLSATARGEHAWDDQLPDLSLAARDAERARTRELLATARALLTLDLSESDRITVEMLVEALDAEVAIEVCRLDEWAVSARTTPLVTLNRLPELNPLDTPDQGDALLARVRARPEFADQQVAALRRGLRDGWVADAEAVRRAAEQVRDQLDQPVSAWPAAIPAPAAWPADRRDRFEQALAVALDGEVRAALDRYATFLEAELLPMARTGDAIGLTGLPDAGACYGALIRQHTTLPLTADEVHQRGLDALAAIHAEMRELAPSVLGTADLHDAFDRLRSDPALYFSSAAEVEAYAAERLAAAQAAVPDWFGRLPVTRCEVRRIPDHEAPYTYVAYYQPPHADGSKPGEYYVNTYAPETRPRFEAAALAYHEAVPGHHFQISLGQELSELPTFRRHAGVTVFVEGWALYGERLADEMGLYPTDLDRFGMLSYQAWRAARLVVDTGIHDQGWSRARAETFMIVNTPLQLNNISNEVDRYVSWPGQALGYMIGQLELQALRAEAEAELGERFDIVAFHDVVLGGGAVPIPVLQRRVRAWIERERG